MCVGSSLIKTKNSIFFHFYSNCSNSSPQKAFHVTVLLCVHTTCATHINEARQPGSAPVMLEKNSKVNTEMRSENGRMLGFLDRHMDEG